MHCGYILKSEVAGFAGRLTGVEEEGVNGTWGAGLAPHREGNLWELVVWEKPELRFRTRDFAVLAGHRGGAHLAPGARTGASVGRVPAKTGIRS